MSLFYFYFYNIIFQDFQVRWQAAFMWSSNKVPVSKKEEWKIFVKSTQGVTGRCQVWDTKRHAPARRKPSSMQPQCGSPGQAGSSRLSQKTCRVVLVEGECQSQLRHKPPTQLPGLLRRWLLQVGWVSRGRGSQTSEGHGRCHPDLKSTV